MKTGRVDVISPGAKFKGRAQFAAVKHSVCNGCGGVWWDRDPRVTKPVPPKGVHFCSCPEWLGRHTNLGVIADSGPIGWKRPFWLIWEQIKFTIDAFKIFRGKTA